MTEKTGRGSLKRNAKRPDLVHLCTNVGIPVTKEVEEGGTKSWIGKPKGMLQIAYKRGLLNLHKYNVEDFSKNGIQGEEEETSLVLLLNQCYDFVNEKIMLSTRNGGKYGSNITSFTKISL